MTLRYTPPGRLNVGTGGSRGPSDPKTVGVGDGGVPNNIWYRESSSSFSIWTRLLHPEIAHDERPERTHPYCPTISRLTTKGESTEVNDKERGGGRKER